MEPVLSPNVEVAPSTVGLEQPPQTVFLAERNIMEGAVILHETIHELHTKKQNGISFKIDFEKDYDKVNWNFLQ